MLHLLQKTRQHQGAGGGVSMKRDVILGFPSVFEAFIADYEKMLKPKPIKHQFRLSPSLLLHSVVEQGIQKNTATAEIVQNDVISAGSPPFARGSQLQALSSVTFPQKWRETRNGDFLFITLKQ